MSLAEKKQELIDELSILPDVQERFAYLIDRAKGTPGLDADYQIETFRIEGCQSNLWLVPSFEAGLCQFRIDSDAIITKGTAGLLADLYSGSPPEEILQHPPDFLSDVGITQHLTPNRRNGLSNVWKTIEGYAQLCLKNEAAGKV
ncbi:MAG: SufE family protein [Verrucomicrobiota bacterium]